MSGHIKGENRAKVIEIRKSNPCATLREIGDKLGVSRQRVYQILEEENSPTKHYKTSYHCCECGKRLSILNKSGLCKDCHHLAHQVPLTCYQCKTLFYRPQNRVLQQHSKHYFCNNHCKGVWLGTNYGRGRPPLDKPSNSMIK